VAVLDSMEEVVSPKAVVLVVEVDDAASDLAVVSVPPEAVPPEVVSPEAVAPEAEIPVVEVDEAVLEEDVGVEIMISRYIL